MYLDELVVALTRINAGSTYVMTNRMVPTEWIYIRKYDNKSYRITHVDKKTEKSLLIKTAPLKEVVDTIFKHKR